MKGERKQRKSSAQLKDFLAILTIGLCKAKISESHFSHVRFSATPWTVAHRVPLSRRFSMQEYWNGLPCPPSGAIPDPGM